MVSKVRVYGKAQNRTCLGIAHAYMVMFPDATLEDLRKAFPNNLNPDKGVKENFIYVDEKGTDANWDGYFREDDEVITTGDNKKVSVVKMWTKPSFERMVAQASIYGIEIASFEKVEKGVKGGFRLEYLNGYIPPKRKSKSMLPWIVVVVILLALLAFLGIKGCGSSEPIVVTDTIVEVKEVIVYKDALEKLETKFNAAQFAKGSAELTDDAKFVLFDVVKLMEKNADLKVQIVGHTSKEGDPAFNQKLSQDRAQAAVNLLISRGIDPSRLEAIGKGSNEPISDTNDEVNRRTEFIVIE